MKIKVIFNILLERLKHIYWNFFVPQSALALENCHNSTLKDYLFYNERQRVQIKGSWFYTAIVQNITRLNYLFLCVYLSWPLCLVCHMAVYLRRTMYSKCCLL